MKITIDLDPGELAKGGMAAVTPAPYASAPAAALDQAASGLVGNIAGAINAGPAPGVTVGPAGTAAPGVPPEVAAQAAAISALSAGPAPQIQ